MYEFYLLISLEGVLKTVIPVISKFWDAHLHNM